MRGQIMFCKVTVSFNRKKGKTVYKDRITISSNVVCVRRLDKPALIEKTTTIQRVCRDNGYDDYDKIIDPKIEGLEIILENMGLTMYEID